MRLSNKMDMSLSPKEIEDQYLSKKKSSKAIIRGIMGSKCHKSYEIMDAVAKYEDIHSLIAKKAQSDVSYVKGNPSVSFNDSFLSNFPKLFGKDKKLGGVKIK